MQDSVEGFRNKEKRSNAIADGADVGGDRSQLVMLMYVLGDQVES